MLAVFLDFDGVINRGSGRWVIPLVEQLNRITDRTGAKIIVALGAHPRRTAKGDIETNDERAIAIQRWLNEHPGEVERFVILDDSPNLGHFVGTPEFIRTEQWVGLTHEQADRAIRHLKGVTW